MTRRIRGFTLIELLVAISIIGVLSSLLLANFVGIRQRARDGVRKSDLRQIQSALELYRSDRSKYPNSPLPGCGSSLVSGGTTYMQKIPCDPSAGAIYTYNSPSGNTTYSIIACLENGNDAQVDMPKVNCPSSTVLWKYTLQNP
jgi:type II secretion system protein G